MTVVQRMERTGVDGMKKTVRREVEKWATLRETGTGIGAGASTAIGIKVFIRFLRI